MKGECKDKEAFMRVKHRQAILSSMIKRKELLLFEYFRKGKYLFYMTVSFRCFRKLNILWNICKEKIKFIRKISGKWQDFAMEKYEIRLKSDI